MRAVWLHIGASVMALAGLILIIAGLSGDDILWQAGLACTVLAMALSFATRWARSESEGDAPAKRSGGARQ